MAIVHMVEPFEKAERSHAQAVTGRDASRVRVRVHASTRIPGHATTCMCTSYNCPWRLRQSLLSSTKSPFPSPITTGDTDIVHFG
jgi:hypothetical protein